MTPTPGTGCSASPSSRASGGVAARAQALVSRGGRGAALAAVAATPALLWVASGGVFPAAAAPAVSAAVAPSASQAQVSVLAQTQLAPGRLTERVTDTAGVFTRNQWEQLDAELKNLQLQRKVKLYVVFVDSFNGVEGQDYATSLFNANKAENVAVVAVAIDGAYGVAAADSSMLEGLRQTLDNAIYPHLVEHDWFAATEAAVQATLDWQPGTVGGGSSSSSSSSGGSGALWLGAGVAGLGAAGVGAVAYAKRSRKQSEAEALDEARGIDPADVTSLKYADITALATLAQEEIVSTDEAIRGAEEELSLASAEFGADRTAVLARRIEQAKAMHAGYLRQLGELSRRRDVSEEELRAVYADVVSHCNATDKELLSQVEEFTSLRNLLIGADARISALTAQRIDALSRLEQVRSTLAALQQRYDEHTLASIAANPDLAQQHLSAAEEALDQARQVAARPAGQQAGLPAAIRAAENALNQADLLLAGVEHADDNIAAARSNLQSLAREVREEIAELSRVEVIAEQDQSDARAAEAAGTKALTRYEATGSADPLGAYTALLDADAQLDDVLDRVKARAAERGRQQQIASDSLQAATQRVQAAEDVISTRGKVIGSAARAALAEATQRLAEAQGLFQQGEFRAAATVARAARKAADDALRAAQRNIDDYNDQQRRRNSGGGGDFLTGMIIGSLLDGGRSGYSGGFGGGGGGWSGGGWSGGSTSSGGAF
ncbi:chromosome partitioning protein ParA [Corynebacterium sp. 13CS0277]|uniref:TPM domain-containing protein n=1 Tax=Corynebacterium sp. 13CS0277 TaxID=2071994 RepID=UPI000D03EFF7|nr:TPM domain-containing protein [Corynebacterium sp. 13CS0277]PRQ10904.1 chromosome partitioning protein ParA [Corynebacterium sp. 13CS0277]